MAFLTAIAANVVKWLLEKGAVLLWAWLRYVWAKKTDHDKLDKIKEDLNKAETKEQIDKVLQDIANHW